MDKNRRKELQEAYKEIKVYMGVYQVKNRINEKIFIGTYPNLKNRWLTLVQQLDMGKHANAMLQKDWNEFGADAFVYEVIERKECKDGMDKKWELKQMEKEWLEKLQPYENRGYHKSPKPE